MPPQYYISYETYRTEPSGALTLAGKGGVIHTGFIDLPVLRAEIVERVRSDPTMNLSEDDTFGVWIASIGRL